MSRTRKSPAVVVPGAAVDEQNTDVGRVAEALRSRVHHLLRRSMHIRTVDSGSCGGCEAEIQMLTSPHYDLHRLGLFFTPAPRHADCLMITGPGCRAMDRAVRATYEAMPGPKIVVAVGACPLGGVFASDQYVHGSVDSLLPVDVWIPGCPPSPLALIHGLLVAVDRLEERVSAASEVAP